MATKSKKKSASKSKDKVKSKNKVISKSAQKPVKKAVKLKGKAAVKSKVPAKVTAKAKSKISAKVKVPPAPKKGLSKPKPQVKPKAEVKPKTIPVTIKTSKPIEKVKEKKLSTSNGNSNGYKLRYSDKDLVEFKGIIIDKLTEARKDLDLLRSSMSHLDDHGTDDTSPTFKLMEDGSDVLTKEETAQLAARQQKFIKHLEDAMVRIENKSYGICRVTGTLIPKERLRVVPHATLSIEAKQKQF